MSASSASAFVAIMVLQDSLTSVTGPIFLTKQAALEWCAKANAKTPDSARWKVRERSLDPTEPESICPASVATLYAFVEE